VAKLAPTARKLVDAISEPTIIDANLALSR